MRIVCVAFNPNGDRIILSDRAAGRCAATVGNLNVPTPARPTCCHLDEEEI